MPWPDPVILTGDHASLEPLSPAHATDLAEAVADGELWRLWYTTIPAPDAMAADIADRVACQAAGTMLAFAVIELESGRAVGRTTYLNLDPANRRLEIGATWYRRSVQRSAINSECKLMLLRHAFETLDCIAVEFRTHFFNHASRRAIERLGAKLDGVLRSHTRLADGSLRDTCVYSITAAEWPAVRRHLTERLARG